MGDLVHFPIIPRQTLGDLIALADAVPEDMVLSRVHEFAEKAKGATDPVEILRNLIMLGVLANRAIFEVCDVPKDSKHVIA